MENWPTPMLFSGFEVGLVITFPYESIARDFAYTADHPIAEAYRIYVGKAEDHPNWDSTAVLEAIRPTEAILIFAAGAGDVGEKDTTTFTPDAQGNCRYLIIKPEETARIRQLMADLASEPPQRTLPPAESHKLAFRRLGALS